MLTASEFYKFLKTLLDSSWSFVLISASSSVTNSTEHYQVGRGKEEGTGSVGIRESSEAGRPVEAELGGRQAVGQVAGTTADSAG